MPFSRMDVCKVPGGIAKNGNKSKKVSPNSNNMMGRFLGTGSVRVGDVNNSRSLDPRRRMGDNVQHGWRNLPKKFHEATVICETKVKNSWLNTPQNLFCSNSHVQRSPGYCDTNVKIFLGEQSKEFFGSRKPFAAKNPRRHRAVWPRDL